MRYQSLLMFLITAAIVSMIASSGFSQCSSGNRGGGFGGYNGQAGGYNGQPNAGGYPTGYDGFNTSPLQPPPPQPALTPAPIAPPPAAPEASGTSIDLDIALPSGKSFDVVIEHPAGAADVKVRTFSDRNNADQLVEQLNQRFWVAYRNAADQPAFREAKLPGDISGIVNEVKANGNQVTGVFPIVARIAVPETTSLEQLLGNGLDAPSVGPSQQLAPEPLAKDTEPKVESQLAAIEGIWAAVARSANGELRTIELKLDSGGWASLSIPDGAGHTTTIERRAVVENGQLKLRDGDQEMTLGQLTQVESNLFVVTTDGGQVTFIKQ